MNLFNPSNHGPNMWGNGNPGDPLHPSQGHGMGALGRLAQRMFPGRFNQQTGGGAQQAQVPQMQTGGGGQMSQLPPPRMTGGPGQVQQAPQLQTGGGQQPNSLAQTFITGGGMQQMGGFNPLRPGLPPGVPQHGFSSFNGGLPSGLPGGVPSGLGGVIRSAHNPFGGFGGFGFGGNDRNTGFRSAYHQANGNPQFFDDRTA